MFSNALNATTNRDVISDFAVGESIQIDNAVFTAFASTGTLSAANFFSGAGVVAAAVGQGAGIYYDTTAGGLYYDQDGFGGSAAIQFASVTGTPALSASNFTVI